MAIQTLLEFATDDMLTHLLIKERAKCRRRNRGETHHTLDKDCDLAELSTRKKLSRLMPPRYTWVRPSKRVLLPTGAADTSKNAEKALLLTVRRDRARQKKGATFTYLDELQAFCAKIRHRIAAGNLTFESPHLMPILKDTQRQADGTFLVTCRPLSVYSQLEDKVVLALTSRYLTRYFDSFLHANILSYRPARSFHDKKHYVTDFNDGVRLIQAYREAHDAATIYAADCDIKKFYDIIPHQVVRECFQRLLNRSRLSAEGKAQVMRVVEAYVASYNYYSNVMQESLSHPEVFVKVARRLHDPGRQNQYKIAWADEIPVEQSVSRGVPQGGALSLLVANIVLNDVDQVLVESEDPDRLFIRYCDDMILLHTDPTECQRLMAEYADSLHRHGLIYHPFTSVAECGRSDFWHIKSHRPFLWGDGDGNRNRYIGFLGYEIRRDGRLRLRKSNIRRFEEKFRRLRYVLRRYAKKHADDEFQTHKQKVLGNVINGIAFYTALDQDRFRLGSQYRHILKLKKQLNSAF